MEVCLGLAAVFQYLLDHVADVNTDGRYRCPERWAHLLYPVCMPSTQFVCHDPAEQATILRASMVIGAFAPTPAGELLRKKTESTTAPWVMSYLNACGFSEFPEIIHALVTALCDMADNFARISTEPRYVVPQAGAAPVSVTTLRLQATSQRTHADALRADMQVLRQQWNASTTDRPDGSTAGKKRQRNSPRPVPSHIQAAHTEYRGATTALRDAAERLKQAELALSRTVSSINSAREKAASLDSIATEIEQGEEFVPVSPEDDAAQGVWAAECFRWQRRAGVVPPPGALSPKLCTKASPTVKGFTPGLFVISCPHGYIYFLKLLRRGESPQVYYDFLRDRCRPASGDMPGNMPRIFCYDNGCNMDRHRCA